MTEQSSALPHDFVATGGGLDSAYLKSLDPALVGAAASRLFAASIGDIVVLFSRSAAHKHYSFADIEWMVMPPAATGQFYVAEAADTKSGFRAPVAVVTWAFVSEELDQRLSAQASCQMRLRPDEWKSGSIGWLIDTVGHPEGVVSALHWLSNGPFREQPLRIIQSDAGTKRITNLQDLLATTPSPRGAT